MVVILAMASTRRLLMNKLRRHPATTVITIVALVLWICFITRNIAVTFVKQELNNASVAVDADTQKKPRDNSKTECICNSQPPPVNNRTSGTRTLIRFTPIPYNENIYNSTFDNVHLFPCTQPYGHGQDVIEDLMCIPRPAYLPDYKNPCYLDENLVLNCMPYYITLGFDKCATTDFSARLQLHPSILKCHGYLDKEIYYWGWRRFGLFMKGSIRLMNLQRYALDFTNAAITIFPLTGQPNQPIVGDGGPTDGWDFRGWQLDPQNKGLSEPNVLTPQNMRHILKDPRFFVLMREPSERLYSDYLFLRYGDTPETFAKDATTAVDMMNACLRVNTTRQCFFSPELYQAMPTRLHIGCYSIFLREWLSVFHRKHFLFLRTEDYKKDIKGSLRSAFSFLGIDTLPDTLIDSIVQQEKALPTKQKTKAGPMFAETRKLLQDFYEPCNQDLADLLGDNRYLWRDT